jgi:hypothetical protein
MDSNSPVATTDSVASCCTRVPARSYDLKSGDRAGDTILVAGSLIAQPRDSIVSTLQSALLFARNILEGKPIDVFNNVHHERDFTFVEDIADGVVRVLERIPQPDPGHYFDVLGHSVCRALVSLGIQFLRMPIE